MTDTTTHRLTGVGVGPGDPELVTVKGVNALREAAVVVVPVMAAADGTDGGEPGRAEATVLHYVPADKVVRVVFALNERLTGPARGGLGRGRMSGSRRSCGRTAPSRSRRSATRTCTPRSRISP